MTKKYLFISNSNKPTSLQRINQQKVRLDNVSIPCVETAILLGFEVFMGINRTYAEELVCENGYQIKFYNQSIYRNLLDIPSNYIAFRNAYKLIKKEKIDVVHCNTPIGGLVGRICGRLGGVSKVIYTAHGFHFYEGAPIINKFIFKWAEMFLAKFTDVIITMNKEDFEAASKFKLRNHGKVFFVPGVGIETRINQLVESEKTLIRNSLNISNDEIVLISIGDLIKRKNYETSLKAIKFAKNPRIRLLICGTGPKMNSLKRLAKKLSIENQIDFLGYRTDVGKLLSISDIFLFTSFQEGLPRSLMEAMSAGLPCIVSNVRGNIDLVKDGEGGMLLDPNDSEGFALAINQLVHDKELRKNMRDINLRIIKEFDILKVKEAILDVYKQTIQ